MSILGFDCERKMLGDWVHLRSGGTPSKAQPDFWNGHIPWISFKDLNGAKLRDVEDYITDIAVANGAKLVGANTILIPVRGMGLAKHFPVSQTTCRSSFNQDLKAVIPKSGLANDYLFYWLHASKTAILAIADEAAHGTKRLQTDRLLQLPFKVPSMADQEKIASILSAYDDLIENNTRRIAILEEMARRIFEEWFVRFRAPGVDPSRLVDSPLGPIPEGWEVKRLGELLIVNPDQIKLGTAPDKIRYIDISSVSLGQIESGPEIAFSNAPGRARRKVGDGDVIWSCVRPNRRSHALILHPDENTIVSTGFAVLRSRGAPFSFIYLTVTTDAFVAYLTNRATGAAYPAVKAEDFEQAEISVPSTDLLSHFHTLIEPKFRLSENLRAQNKSLRAQRDLLLPKLVSGEIDVSAAEQIIRDAAA